jgi:glycosyltransferase involved in cell wall biosynthesis
MPPIATPSSTRTPRQIAWYLSPHDMVPGDTWGYDRADCQIRALEDAGYEVVYFAATFSHATKQVRGAPWTTTIDKQGRTLVLVPVRAYASHGSLRRMASLFDFAFHLWRAPLAEFPRPALIFSSMPTPFLDVVSVLLARRHKARFVQDFRDLWPELFVHAFPARLKALGKLLIQPLVWTRRWSLKNTDAYVAVTQEYLDFGLAIAPELRARPNAVVYCASDPYQPAKERVEPGKLAAMTKTEMAEVWLVYAGTLGNNYDIRSVLRAFELAAAKAPFLRLKIAGDGPLRPLVLEAAERNPEVVSYLGALNKDELWSLLEQADIGLLPYAGFSTVSVPAKTFDYLAAGLPIINSLPGEVDRIIKTNDIGRRYESGNVDDLVNAMLELAGDRDKLDAMRGRASQAARQYSRAHQYGQVTALLQKL